jgi:2-haloacid dehalogenase
MAIDLIVFDIGNVLVEWHPEATYDRLIGPERRRALFGNVDLAGMNDRVDMGEEIADVVRECADLHPEYRDDILLWHTHWIDMCAPAIPHSAVLLRALRAKSLPVVALSNFGISTLALADTHYPVLTEFDRRFVSGHMQMMKPNADIYAMLESETGVDPGGIFFTDDRAENIDAAAARGWQTHLFETPQGLADRLVAEGLLTATEAAP